MLARSASRGVFGLGLGLALTLGATTAASAQDAFGTFEDLCISTNADADAAIQGAEALDFSQAPEDVIIALAGSFKDVRALLNNRPMDVVGLGAMAVITGKMPIRSGADAPLANACAVMVYGGDAAVLAQKVANWTGFDPVSSETLVWGYVVEGGRRVPAPDLKEFSAGDDAFKSSDLKIIGVSSTGAGASYLFLSAPPT